MEHKHYFKTTRDNNENLGELEVMKLFSDEVYRIAVFIGGF